MLQVEIYDGPSGTLIADVTSRVTELAFSTHEHGFEALSCVASLPLAEVFRLYDRPGLPHVLVADGAAGVVWEGRLEDVALVDGGVSLRALGYWRALSDAPYSALWSDTSTAGWEPVTPDNVGSRLADRYEMDTNNRLYLAPRKGESFSTAAIGSLSYVIPHASARQIVRVSFSYDLTAPAGWRASMSRFSDGYGLAGTDWTLDGNGSSQTGSQDLFIMACDRLMFNFYCNNAAPAAFTGETGTVYLKITNVRVRTTTATNVSADEIAKALAAYVASINASQLRASIALIEAPGVDLRDESYEDETPADILTRLCALGDDQTPPRAWETGVWEDRRLHLRPRGPASGPTAGRAWFVDALDLQLERSLDGLRNSAYGVYQTQNGRTQRTATTTDAGSVARYGVTRRAAVSCQTTSATQAGVQRDAAVADGKALRGRAGLTIRTLYDGAGGRWPLWAARSGDTITIRNLPPTLSLDVDRIRTFRISRTEYDAVGDVLTVEPEEALPRLEVLLARRGEGL